MRAQVPSKVSVSSAVRKMINADSGVPPVNASTNKTDAKINLDKVRMSAKYFMNLL